MTEPRRSRLASAIRRRWGAGRPADEVVDELFRALLLRPADEESLDYYVRALGRGLPWESVVESVATSVEATENSWRAPVAAALGPALLAQADQRPVYVALPPGAPSRAAEAVEGRFPNAGERLVLGGFDLDQLYWTPALVRRRAGLVTGPTGRAGRDLVAPDSLAVAVVAPPSGADGDAPARCLVGTSVPGRAWIDFDPVEEASVRGLDAGQPLQALNRAGPDDLDGADLAATALEVLDRFDLVLALEGEPAGPDPGPGPDGELYCRAREAAG